MKALSLSAILFGFILPLASAKEETEVPFGQCPAPVQAMIKQNAQQVRGTIEKVEKEKTKDSEFYDAKIAGADGSTGRSRCCRMERFSSGRRRRRRRTKN